MAYMVHFHFLIENYGTYIFGDDWFWFVFILIFEMVTEEGQVLHRFEPPIKPFNPVKKNKNKNKLRNLWFLFTAKTCRVIESTFLVHTVI